MGLGILSHITKNKVLPCIQPALFHIPQESYNLFFPAHLPLNNPQCSVPCSLFGLPGQYKEAGSLHQSVVGADGVKSQRHFHQQVNELVALLRIVKTHCDAIEKSAAPVSIFFKLPLFSLTAYCSPQHAFRSRSFPDHCPCGTDGRAGLQRPNHTLAQTSDHQEAPSSWEQRWTDHHHDPTPFQQPAHRWDNWGYDGRILPVPYRQHHLLQWHVLHWVPHRCRSAPREHPWKLYPWLQWMLLQLLWVLSARERPRRAHGRERATGTTRREGPARWDGLSFARKITFWKSKFVLHHTPGFSLPL